VIESLQATWGTISQLIASINLFVDFLKAVKGGSAGPAFAKALASAGIVLLDFVANFLIAKLGSALKKLAGKLKGLAKRLMKKGKGKKGKKKKKKKDEAKKKDAKDKKKGKDKKKDRRSGKRKGAPRKPKRKRKKPTKPTGRRKSKRLMKKGKGDHGRETGESTRTVRRDSWKPYGGPRAGSVRPTWRGSDAGAEVVEGNETRWRALTATKPRGR
jgi:hypothetical protein